MTTPYFLGIDISKDKFDVALLQDKSIQHTGTFSNDLIGYTKLVKWLKKRNILSLHACIEATGRYGNGLAQFLYEQEYDISVVNPARIKAYASSQLKRNKTDKEDARLIAHFCMTQDPLLWTPPPPIQAELQELSRRVAALKEERQRERNRQASGIQSAFVLQTLADHIAFLDSQIILLQQQMQDLIAQDNDLKKKQVLLTSIPGLGDLSAAIFLAEAPDTSLFCSASQLAAYAGLTPKQHVSGSSIHRPSRLTKTGNSRLRTLFFMPALVAIRFNPIIKSLVSRLEQRGKPRMVIVGAVMRKLLHLAYGVLKTGIPFDPNYLANVQTAP